MFVKSTVSQTLSFRHQRVRKKNLLLSDQLKGVRMLYYFLTISTWPLSEVHVSASEFWANKYTLLWVACSRHSDGVKQVKMANAKAKRGWKNEGLLSFFFSPSSSLSLVNFSSVPHHLNSWNRICCRLVKVHLYENYLWFFRVMLSCHSYPFLFPLYGSPSIFMEQQKLKFCFNFLKKKERWALNKF